MIPVDVYAHLVYMTMANRLKSEAPGKNPDPDWTRPEHSANAKA